MSALPAGDQVRIGEAVRQARAARPAGRAAGLLAWIGALFLLAVALHPKNPYLLVVRAGETSMLLLLSGLGLGLLLWRGRKASAEGRGARWRRRLLGGLLLVVQLLAIAHEIDFRRQRAEVLAAGPEARRLGQHFIVGFTRFDAVAPLAERGLIGGIYLGRGNVRGRTLGEIRGEIDALQALRAKAGLPPLIVAADQEGGSVAHMSPPLPALPALASLVAAGTDASLEARARAYGETQARGLAALGINMNFGPVADLLPVNGGPAFDTHTLIARRAIAGDPAVVARVVRAYGEGLSSQGVMPTLKHFPGLGEVKTDTHHFPARLATPATQLAAHDWQPFRSAPPGSAMMLAHVIVPEIDAEHPASLSPPVVQGLLRRRWGYEGLLLTDDLNMGAVYRLGIGEAAVSALTAGVDLLLVTFDPDQYFRAMYAASEALRRGRLDEAQLAGSRQRLARAFPAVRESHVRATRLR
jgi:beta-N-acetylhexosaminidase